MQSLILIVVPDGLCVTVIQGQDDWGVTYTSTKICAVKGSTVEIHCSYRYPSRINGPDTKVENAFWFIEKKNVENVYLKDDPRYSGRVQYDRDEIKNDCTLRITDLRESDSAVYKFRFITNHPNAYTGEPGVTLSVTDLKVSRSSSSSYLQCHSSRYLPDHTSYIWYKNGQKIKEDTSPYVDFSSDSADSYSCAVKGCGGFPSPSVYAPKLPSVSVSPSAEIVEGSSVTLTCSSDANPAAKYTWYKENEDSPKASGQIFTISNVTAEHSGNYYCEAQNTRGRHNSTLHLTVVADRSSSGAGKLVAAGTITVVLLAVILLAVFLWIRKKRASRDSSEPGERADNREQRQPEEQGDLQYASIRFSNQADPLYYNMRPAQPLRHTEQREDVEYVTVKFNSARTAPRTRGRGGGADPAALYSTVNKSR
ncbi:cell adhesion molecule CEACAM6-like [Epinephelus lanceolatus]